jgi:hypothetical protein
MAATANTVFDQTPLHRIRFGCGAQILDEKAISRNSVTGAGCVRHQRSEVERRVSVGRLIKEFHHTGLEIRARCQITAEVIRAHRRHRVAQHCRQPVDLAGLADGAGGNIKLAHLAHSQLLLLDRKRLSMA